MLKNLNNTMISIFEEILSYQKSNKVNSDSVIYFINTEHNMTKIYKS